MALVPAPNAGRGAREKNLRRSGKPRAGGNVVEVAQLGYEGILAIRGSSDGVKLYFTRGKELPDPNKVLSGSGQARSLNVESASTLSSPEVERFIDEAIARNRTPFATEGQAQIVIRSKSTGKRSQRS